MGRALKLNETQVSTLAKKYLEADTEGKKVVLKEYGVSKHTMYRGMTRYGISFLKIIH